MNSDPVPAEPPETAAPVDDPQRIRSLDVLRGFALFGVLLMNMQAFAEVFAVYMNPFALGEISTLDYAVWCLNYLLADGKFMTIFSMLFGAGIVLMTDRSRARTGRSAGVHYRRMFWLMLFGVAHALLIWKGDILFMYGLIGLVAFWFRRVRPWIQISIATVLLLIPTTFLSSMHYMPAEDLAELREFWAPTPQSVQSTHDAMRGSYLEQLQLRVDGWIGNLEFIVIFGWRVLACMLLGMALYKRGVFSATRSGRFYVALIVIGFGVGFPLAAWGIYDHQAHNWDLVRSMGVGSLFNYFGSLLAALGYVGVVMLVCRAEAMLALRRGLGAVGQMAFTNYIMQSVICTAIYNGHGLGLYGQVDRIWQQVLAVTIFAVQMWYSPRWLQRFYFGPLEWLWRTLTYWQRQPFRRI